MRRNLPVTELRPTPSNRRNAERLWRVSEKPLGYQLEPPRGSAPIVPVGDARDRKQNLASLSRWPRTRVRATCRLRSTLPWKLGIR